MTTICPTVTVTEPHAYREQVEKIIPFALRVHIDLSDGIFSPVKLIDIDNVWWPGGMRADLHVMYQNPTEHLPAMTALGPQLIIVHAEADGDFASFAKLLHNHGIEVGVALLPSTPVAAIAPALAMIDHVLIFSGDLGHYGGQADLNLLSKVRELRTLKPTLEIGWDGGVNDQNVQALVHGGVDVLNAGGYIANAENPAQAYATLKALADNKNG